MVVVLLTFIKPNGLCEWAISFQLCYVDSKIDNFHNSWPSQEVIHNKIILTACFDSSVENILFNQIDFPNIFVKTKLYLSH